MPGRWRCARHQHLDQPAFELRVGDADGLRGLVHVGAVLPRLFGGHADGAPVRAVGFVVAVQRCPQRQESVEHRLAPRRFLDVVQQLQCRAAVDRATFETHVVADLAEAGAEYLGHRGEVEVGARTIGADRRGGAVGTRARVIAEGAPHRGERVGLVSRELRLIDRGELRAELCAVAFFERLPGSKIAASVFPVEAGLDSAEGIRGVEKAEEFRLGRGQRIGGGRGIVSTTGAQQEEKHRHGSRCCHHVSALSSCVRMIMDLRAL